MSPPAKQGQGESGRFGGSPPPPHSLEGAGAMSRTNLPMTEPRTVLQEAHKLLHWGRICHAAIHDRIEAAQAAQPDGLQLLAEWVAAWEGPDRDPYAAGNGPLVGIRHGLYDESKAMIEHAAQGERSVTSAVTGSPPSAMTPEPQSAQPEPALDILPRNVLIDNDHGFKGRWVAVPREDFDRLRAAFSATPEPAHEHLWMSEAPENGYERCVKPGCNERQPEPTLDPAHYSADGDPEGHGDPATPEPVTEPATFVHNHGTEDGPGLDCVEYSIGGHRTGACLLAAAKEPSE